MTAEFDSYSNLPYQWKDGNSNDSHKWLSEVPNSQVHHEETHSDTASSPQSSSGTIASDVVSSLSPESQPTTVSPITVSSNENSTQHYEAASAEMGIKQEEIAPIEAANQQEYSELKLVISDPSDESKHDEDVMRNLPNADPSLPPTISIGAKFDSFAHFESIFESWKRQYFHPFRVASSETMRHPDGQQDPIFRYRYIVYHCVHYGNPRMRGNGKRPNQSYLPSGCKAMLRLNFSYNDNSLRITTLQTEHQNHEIGPEHFNGKLRKISPLSESNHKQENSPRSVKSSSSSKPSPATTLSSSQIHSLSNSPSVPFSSSHSNTISTSLQSETNEPKPSMMKTDVPVNNTHASLATMLAAAYSNNNNANNNFSMFQSSQPPAVTNLIAPQIPIINNNSLAALLSQKENNFTSTSSLPKVAPIMPSQNHTNNNLFSTQIQNHQPQQQQQQQSLQDMLKRENLFSSLLGTQMPNESNPLAQIYEALQKHSFQNALEQYRLKMMMQENLQSKIEEYRSIVNLLSNGNIPTSNLAAMEQILAILRPAAEILRSFSHAK